MAVAGRFLDAVESTLRQLEQTPKLGRFRDERRVRDVRVWRGEGFPSHLLFSRPARGDIELIQLLHAKQDIERVLDDLSRR